MNHSLPESVSMSVSVSEEGEGAGGARETPCAECVVAPCGYSLQATTRPEAWAARTSLALAAVQHGMAWDGIVHSTE